MITDQDVKGYLKQILDMENQMKSKYAELAQEAEDENMKEVLQSLSRDEEQHAELVADLMDIFGGGE